ncbi:hypothetical protein [Nostoc sp.]|uniref:hypothetical protein n=1 Tax=Nostoc sp. TaxID=1180 RepID=UPI002FFC5079
MIFEIFRRGGSRVGGFTDLSVSVAVATQEGHWRCVSRESTAPSQADGALQRSV